MPIFLPHSNAIILPSKDLNTNHDITAFIEETTLALNDLLKLQQQQSMLDELKEGGGEGEGDGEGETVVEAVEE